LSEGEVEAMVFLGGGIVEGRTCQNIPRILIDKERTGSRRSYIAVSGLFFQTLGTQRISFVIIRSCRGSDFS
jgi:hypothetical protein